jgi:hypothetical protein
MQRTNWIGTTSDPVTDPYHHERAWKLQQSVVHLKQVYHSIAIWVMYLVLIKTSVSQRLSHYMLTSRSMRILTGATLIISSTDDYLFYGPTLQEA